MRYDVAIMGGGVIGCAIARELTRYHLRVILIEKESEVGFGATKSNSGVIHAGHHASSSTLKGRLEWAGNPMWDDLAADLGFGFRRIGELTVALNAEQVAVLDKLKAQGEGRGVPGLEIWDQSRIRREEPDLSEAVVAALYAPTTGVVNPYEACYALLESARRNGLELHLESQVRALESSDHVISIHTERALIHSRFAINCAGLYADHIAQMAGVQTFTILPRKGEEYLLDKRLAGMVKRVIFPCPTPVSKGILVIPTFDGTIMVGPTAHDTLDRADLATTASGAEEVFTAVKTLVPGISERDCIAEFAGLRAAASGDDFIIGPTARKGFINVAGIQSPGLTAAPAIAVMVAEILRAEGLAMTLNEAFEPCIPQRQRFMSLPLDQQARLAESDPSWAHVVCRCEGVTEREIIDAVHDGARTLDGLKFRTRAGMGRCQGGFCAWRCMQLLSRELGLPLTAITKRGAGSWLVQERRGEVV